MKISKATAIDNFLLQIKTDNGLNGIFDVKPYLNDEAFISLQNQDEFKKIRNAKYYIEWECGADLSADTVEAHLKYIK